MNFHQIIAKFLTLQNLISSLYDSGLTNANHTKEIAIRLFLKYLVLYLEQFQYYLAIFLHLFTLLFNIIHEQLHFKYV